MSKYTWDFDDDGTPAFRLGERKGGEYLSFDDVADRLNSQAETIAAQQQVLDQIAAALGVETGDVEGTGLAIERLKKGHAAMCEALPLVLKQLEDAMNYKHPEDPWEEDAMVMGEFFDEKTDKAVELAKKALAAGEAV